MKLKYTLFAVLFATSITATAATNDLTSALQQALFEEEVNHDLPAAIKGYQGLIDRLDQQRKLAATAVFRLGECYRKQGDTNAAAAQYQRLLRDFADQSQLMSLGRQSLSALGVSSPTQDGSRVGDLPASVLNRVLQVPSSELPSALAQQTHDPLLNSLLKNRSDAEQELAKLTASKGRQHPNVVAQEAVLKTIGGQIDRQVGALLAGLKAMQSPVALNRAQTSERDDGSQSTEQQEIDDILKLIHNSPDLINAPQKDGQTLLASAAAKGQVEVMKVLLENGAAINGIRQPDLTALHQAALNGNKAAVDFLLSKGANPNAVTGAGVTPLHIACVKGYEAVSKALLDAGADPKAATRSGSAGEALDGRLGQPGRTALHAAAMAGYLNLVQLLLTKGAEPNAIDGKGRTALSYAAESNFGPVVQALLAGKANPNAGEKDLPLCVAAWYGAGDAMDLLLKAGADPNVESALTWSPFAPARIDATFRPLHLAVLRNDPKSAKHLIQAGADANQSFQGTPLLFITLEKPALNPYEAQPAGNSKDELLQVLLDAKADPNGRAYGAPALMRAAANNVESAIEMLLKAGADPNATDPQGYTALYLAVNGANLHITKLLLEHGADPNTVAKSESSPLDLAKRIQSAEGSKIVQLLREHGALDDLPRLDRIVVRRAATRFEKVVFKKGTNDWIQVTLLEALIKSYFPSRPPTPGQFLSSVGADAPREPNLSFPDLKRITIRRPDPKTKTWTTLAAKATEILEEGDCSKDQRLFWGDVIEVPELDHPVGAVWEGFQVQVSTNLSRCVTRKVTLNNQHQTKEMELHADLVRGVGFWLKDVLYSSRLVLISSDVSRVKVKRAASTWAPAGEWTVDCTTKGITAGAVALPGVLAPGQVVDAATRDSTDFWLRDGDVIEIPEKQS